MSLLGEMLDRDAITRFPEPSYRMKLFSSYDRASTLPGEPNWDANADFNQFLRIEENAGREERVLVDADGPGALVRFWFAGIGHDSAILRVYVDGAAEPAIEGAAGEIAGGEMLAGWPLSAGLSPDSPAPERGINLYLPIPFARHVKVTAEITMTPRERAMFYYNIETRLYARDTEVESFSKKVSPPPGRLSPRRTKNSRRAARSRRRKARALRWTANLSPANRARPFSNALERSDISGSRAYPRPNIRRSGGSSSGFSSARWN
ncbi:MAG: DUF2961 domain-containing protein [Kiritimatiellae bacterium]|nr:DUF2961 domain-containing protein [Kiritimatiellia bacterium]